MNKFAYRPNPTGLTFVIQNITGTKFISVFTTTIAPGATVDLMAMPGISEEQIKSSLIKGELYFRLRTHDIKILNSNINLLTFDTVFQSFLNQNNITTGTLIPARLIEAGATTSSGLYNCSPGMPLNSLVYLSSPDAIDLADCNSPSKQPVIGVVQARPSTTTANVLYFGELSGFTGLIPSATYYLDSVPGKATASPPTSVGQIVQKIGFAKDSTTLSVMINREFTVL